MTESQALFEIGAQGVDVERLVERIREEVERKRAEGAWADPRIARAERANLVQFRNEEDFFDFFMDCLRNGIYVDINDFDIRERRTALSPLLVRIKRVLWKLLKFYTYRLWSQQNQVNGLLLAAAEEVDRKYAARIRELEARLTRLETPGTSS